MMAYIITALAAILWFSFFCLLMMSQQTQKARIKKRFSQMLKTAESDHVRDSEQKQSGTVTNDDNTVIQHKNFADMSLYERIVRPFFNFILTKLSSMAPGELYAMLENQIFRTGKQDKWSVRHLAAGWVLSVGLGLFLAFLFINSRPDLVYPQRIIIIIMGAATGATVPFFTLQSVIERRKERLRRQMPEFIDLICISVQAGLSFDGAVNKVTGRLKSDLSNEFKRMEMDIRHGMNRQRSLTQMAKRCDIEEMYLFTASVIQADRLGTGMSRMLKVQADNIRDRYRQAIKADAMKTPIKIIFPIIIFIFPSIFVIVLLPMALTMIDSLGK